MDYKIRRLRVGAGFALVAMLFTGGITHAQESGDRSIPNWVEVGNANWNIGEDQISADAGSGFLVTRDSYSNFELTVKFKPGAETNSGIFLRCSDPANISDTTCYEVNIFDQRPDPSGRTGGIVHVASPNVSINTERQWNTYHISAQGHHLIVKLNGVVTVDTYDERFDQGVIALQLASGNITFKDLSINRDFNKAGAIRGVWKLTKFELDDGAGKVQPWCKGSHGTIMYTQNYMSVSINCKTDPSKKVFYSGPYHLEGNHVVHDVDNYSDTALKQKFIRKVEMPAEDKLDLVGPFGANGKAVVSWVRWSKPQGER